MFALFAFPMESAKFFSEGISLWAITVLPSIFPFLFLMTVLSSFGLLDTLTIKTSPFFEKLFGISGTGGCIFLLSVLSGYPIGSKLISDNADVLSNKEREKLAPLCSLPSPLFLIGCVGRMFQDTRVGFLLWGINLLSVLIIGFLSRFGKASQARSCLLPRRTLSESMTNCILSILSVGAYLALFSVLSGFITLLPFCPNDQILLGMLRGLFEMTMGICTLASATPLAFACTAFLVTFGGACILMQQITFLSGKIKLLPFLWKKFLQGMLAFLFALLVGAYYF